MARAKARSKKSVEPQARLREVEVADSPIRFVWADPTSLDANPLNWKIHPDEQTTVVKDLIGRHGWITPLVYNLRTARLLDGHDRRKIAIEQATAAVPVIIGDWPEESEPEILLALDPSGSLAKGDPAAMDRLMRQVSGETAAIGRLISKTAEAEGVLQYLAAQRAANGGSGESTPRPVVDDPNAEWVGMPAFQQEDQRGERTLLVHFKCQADVDEFAQVIGQPITERTRYLWFPKNEIVSYGECE